MRRPTSLALLLAALAPVASCGGVAPASIAPAAAAKSAEKAAESGPFVTPSRLVPDVLDGRGTVLSRGGERLVLADRMRLTERDDGVVRRARELFPPGNVRATELPSRLGGGFLFYATGPGGTELWRSESWLGELSPLTEVSSIADEVRVGLDRLFIRLASSNRLLAVDARSGKAASLASLPPSAAYGPFAFVDGWRGVVVTDLRGPLATFDAGQSYRPLGIPNEAVSRVEAEGSGLRVYQAGGSYLVDERGSVTYRPDGGADIAALEQELAWFRDVSPAIAAPSHGAGPLGPRPLRTALLRGFPSGMTEAIVAHEGSLFRVSLADGRIVDDAPALSRKDVTCAPVRFGPLTPAPYGFVCGAPDGPTQIHAFAPPLGLREVRTFAEPRLVVPSDNGRLVVRGPCEGSPSAAKDTQAYCILEPDGRARDVLVRGRPAELGTERVVALEHERTAILVPPRLEEPGQVIVLEGRETKAKTLVLPDKPTGIATLLQRGLWLQGFGVVEPGVLGGWVEAGGPVVGVRVRLADGVVSAGPRRDDTGGAVVSGRFALSFGETGHLAESSDGGFTWRELDAPDMDEDPSRQPERACGPLGCVFGPWLRVGWGADAVKDDLAGATSPKLLDMPLRISQTLSFRCEPWASYPLPAAILKPPAPPAPKKLAVTAETRTGWLPFRGSPAPTLGPDELGFDASPRYDSTPMRVYAWGKRGADWQRAGQWLLRFDDAFDPSPTTHTTAPATPPWADEAATSDALGLGSRGASWTFSAELDPSGKAALVSACRSGTCELFGAVEGAPPARFRDSAGRYGTFRSPMPDGSVRLGETWFFVVPTFNGTSSTLTLYRVDLGTARPLATYPRPARSNTSPAPRLVRRAGGTGLGLLFVAAQELGLRPERGRYHVLPIDPETGELGDAIPLSLRDLSDAPARACAAAEDGWLFDTTTDIEPILQGTGAYQGVSFDAVELRVRVDPKSLCIEGFAARTAGPSGRVTRGSGPAAGTIPLVATVGGTGERAVLACSPIAR
jgi:hypothetical protein